MDLRALELSILRYAKNGRPQNCPRVLSPTLNGISYSPLHSHYTDQIIANFLGPSLMTLVHLSPFILALNLQMSFCTQNGLMSLKILLAHDPLTFLNIKMTLSLHQKFHQIEH